MSKSKRIESFKRAYPDLADVQDNYIIRLLKSDKQVARCADSRLKEMIGQIDISEKSAISIM